MESADAAAGGQGEQKVRRMGILLAAALLGGSMGAACLVMLLVRQSGGGLPILTAEAFEAAKAQWESAAPSSYEIEITVSGRQAAVYVVTVDQGKVLQAFRNGYPLKQERTKATWSVPGMFSTMQSDVDNLLAHQDGTATAVTPRVRLNADFEPQFGYPMRYNRTELQRFGNNQNVSWEVTSFKVL